jgi:hypothetical protein
VCLTDPRTGDWIPTSEITGSAVCDGSGIIGALQDALRAEFGPGYTVVRVDEPHRTVNGHPRALPEALSAGA